MVRLYLFFLSFIDQNNNMVVMMMVLVLVLVVVLIVVMMKSHTGLATRFVAAPVTVHNHVSKFNEHCIKETGHGAADI